MKQKPGPTLDDVLNITMNCHDKMQYQTESEAASACVREKKRFGDKFIIAYQCKFCRRFHLGHKTKGRTGRHRVRQ